MKNLNWFDFSGAVRIKKSERDGWVHEVLGYLKDDPTLHHFSISSGDSVVIATRNETGEITVMDCVLRREATLYNEDL